VARDLIAVILCLLGSGFFSASETALTSLPLTRLEALRRSSGRLTRAGLDRWATAPQELLITILVGNNLVNVLASALATSIAYRISPNGGLAVVVGVMTLVILVFGEVTPKTLAQRHAQWIAARVAPVLYLLDVVLTPLNKVLGLLTRVLSRHQPIDLPVTEEDLLFMARLAHRHAQLARDARIMIERVVRFQRAVAREVMVPRPLVVTVDQSWPAARLREFLVDSPHSRFPVIDGSPDNIVGVLHAKSLLRVEPGQPWTDQIVPPLFIPESKPLPALMHDLRTSGQHLAVILDEYGGFSGVVSLEDALELVVGEIEDEFDQEKSGTLIQVEGGWSVPGHLSLRRLEVLLHRTIAEPAGVDSVGGLAAHLLGDGLRKGATAEQKDFQLTVEDIEDGRASRVIVTLIQPGAGHTT
jgi:CBS domain containing-hemolysin-like protein